MTNDIYTIYNIDRSILKRDYIKNPLQLIPRNNHGGLIKEKPYKEDLGYLYVEMEIPKQELCLYFGIGKTTFNKWLKENDIKRKKDSTNRLRESTCMKRYGVKHNSQIVFVKNNNKSKNFEKYGVEHYFQSDDFKAKCKETLQKINGVNHNSQMKSVQSSIKHTNYEKYGNENFSRSNHFRECLGLKHLDNDVWNIIDNKYLFEKYMIDNNIESIEQMSILLGVSKGFINNLVKQYDLKKYIVYSSSYPEKCWLDTLHICKNNRQVRIGKYIVDGYDPNTNTIYEFLGDYWHGNPKIYNQFEYNKKVGKTFGELYENTIKRNKELELMGYNVVCMWESDYNLTI